MGECSVCFEDVFETIERLDGDHSRIVNVVAIRECGTLAVSKTYYRSCMSEEHCQQVGRL